jgi:hypothetical protein
MSQRCRVLRHPQRLVLVQACALRHWHPEAPASQSTHAWNLLNSTQGLEHGEHAHTRACLQLWEHLSRATEQWGASRQPPTLQSMLGSCLLRWRCDPCAGHSAKRGQLRGHTHIGTGVAARPMHVSSSR